ncbi:alpha/beta fold hydrolase [Roseivivax sp. CAU 1761]
MTAPGAVPAGIHWRRYGDGPDPALFLHCALAHGGLWRGVAERLGDRLAVAAPDMPGHGRSAPWDGGDLHDQVTALAASALRPGDHLVGHSFGGTVALRLALGAGPRPASLTLVEPVLFAAARAAEPEVFDAQEAAFRPVWEAAAAGDLERAARDFTALWGDPGAPWEALDAARRQALAAGMPTVAATRDVLHADAKGLLAPGGLERLDLPVLLIRGADSPPVVAAIHRALLARLPAAREVVVPGAGHMVPLTHAGAVAAAIAEQLAAVAA